MSIYWAIVLAYLLGGIWGVLAFARSGRDLGLRSKRKWVELGALAFILWPLILGQIIFISIYSCSKLKRKRL